MIGKLESAVKRAGRDAPIKHLGLAAVAFDLRGARTANGQGVFPRLDEILFREASYGDRNSIGVFAGSFDIVRRIARRGFEPSGLVKHAERQRMQRNNQRGRDHIDALHILLELKRHVVELIARRTFLLPPATLSARP